MNEIHLAQTEGHVPSADCWCEPQIAQFTDGQQNLNLVRHYDYSFMNHKQVLKNRELSKDWITSFLNTIAK